MVKLGQCLYKACNSRRSYSGQSQLLPEGVSWNSGNQLGNPKSCPSDRLRIHEP